MKVVEVLVFIGLVLIGLAWAESDPRPRLLVEDSTTSTFHHAAAADPHGGHGARIAQCVILEPRPPVPIDDA